MKKIQQLLTGLLAMAGLASCKKDFLDKSPLSSLTENNFFANESDLNTYCNGLYSYLPGWSLAIGDNQSDNYENNPYNRVVAGQLVVPTSASSAGWTWDYLRQVNYFLQNYRKAQASDVARNHYAGIARFFRAWFYFDKVKRFGDVPWYASTVLPNDSASLYKGRDPRALVMDSVIADLRFAVNNIKPTGASGTITKWVALALLARVGLHEGTFRGYRQLDGWQPLLQLADSAATAVMQSGNFKLYQTGQPAKDYYNLFNIFTPNDAPVTEVILASYYSQSLHTTHPLSAELNQGYGYSLTKDLVNTYLMKDGTAFTSIPGYDTLSYTKEFANRDPRLSQTVIAPDYKRQGKPFAPLIGPAPTGYQQIKYYVDDPAQTGWNTSYNAAIVFRLAEMLLIHAEARAELGTLTQADLDNSVNLLRDRVQMPHLFMNAPIDAVLSQQYPNVNGSQKNLILEIRRERRVELACENFRYDDLMRWKAGALLAKPFVGIYFPHLGAYDLNGDGQIDYNLVTSLPSNPATGVTYKVVGKDIYLTNGNSGNVIPYPNLVKTFDENKNYLFPLPTTELLLNKNLTQNPLW